MAQKLPLIGAKLFRGKLDKLDASESATIQELTLKLGVSSEQFVKLAGQNERAWSQFILKAIELLQASARAVDGKCTKSYYRLKRYMSIS